MEGAVEATARRSAPDASGWGEPAFPVSLAPRAADLRVAVVGTGPAASYTAAALLTTSATVTMIDRLEQPGGLVRFGVAPDHVSTRAIGERFATLRRHPRLELSLGLEVGRDVSHEELLAHHDAVVYATGASADRTLGIVGESLPGSLAARTLVGWYNHHPEVGSDVVDPTSAAARRVVVVGNGNVALDVARVLLGDPESLVGTEVAPHALAALRSRTVAEVVVVGRRGPGHAAYSLPELRAVLAREDLDVVLDAGHDREALVGAIEAAEPGSRAHALRGLPVVDLDEAPDPAGRPRLVLRFHSVVAALEGSDRVEGVLLAPTGADPCAALQRLGTGLLVRSVGYRSEPLAGLPFDEETHTVPHDEGRVVEPVTRRPVPGAYVVGWAKRGPRGGIGSNRADAAETVASLVSDANDGTLPAGTGSRRAWRRLARVRRAARSLSAPAAR